MGWKMCGFRFSGAEPHGGTSQRLKSNKQQKHSKLIFPLIRDAEVSNWFYFCLILFYYFWPIFFQNELWKLNFWRDKYQNFAVSVMCAAPRPPPPSTAANLRCVHTAHLTWHRARYTHPHHLPSAPETIFGLLSRLQQMNSELTGPLSVLVTAASRIMHVFTFFCLVWDSADFPA